MPITLVALANNDPHQSDKSALNRGKKIAVRS